MAAAPTVVGWTSGEKSRLSPRRPRSPWRQRRRISSGVGRTFREDPPAGGPSPRNGVFRAPRAAQRAFRERPARADHSPTAEKADGGKGNSESATGRNDCWEKCSSSASQWTRSTFPEPEPHVGHRPAGVVCPRKERPWIQPEREWAGLENVSDADRKKLEEVR